MVFYLVILESSHATLQACRDSAENSGDLKPPYELVTRFCSFDAMTIFIFYLGKLDAALTLGDFI